MPTEAFTQLSNKRKRETSDHADGARARKSQDVNGDAHRASEPTMNQISERLLQGLANPEGSPPSEDNQRTAQAALNTPLQTSNYPNPEPSFDSASSEQYGIPFDASDLTPSTQSQLQAAREVTTQNTNKPAVGSSEWHAQRKNNHKEVERRRRETINEGINELAKIVPNCEKNKGSILQKAVTYITDLTTKERSWVTERTTIDVALKEVTETNKRLKKSQDEGWAEAMKWQKRCHAAGLAFDDYDTARLDGETEDEGLGASS